MTKILIVDDSAMMRAVLKNFITSEGHEIVEAVSGSDAVTKFRQAMPDLTFMDILMPGGMDGFKALEEIKKIKPGAKVVMVTSLREDSDVTNAKKLGANGYITKPFSKDQIVNAIKENI